MPATTGAIQDIFDTEIGRLANEIGDLISDPEDREQLNGEIVGELLGLSDEEYMFACLVLEEAATYLTRRVDRLDEGSR